MHEGKIPLTVIGGPTASGKTALAIKIAQEQNGEIVSADSMQVYKYMDIGSAKPTTEEQAMVKHHLIDIIYPDTNFNVVEYSKLAHDVIADIHLRGKHAILVGGTGMYINSVIDATAFNSSQSDTALRNELVDMAKEKGNLYIHQMLEKIDPSSAKRLHPNDLRRIIRAIEVYETTGITITEHAANSKGNSPYDINYLAIEHNREFLYERIDRRVDKMFEQGLINEVENLVDMGYGSRNSTAMQAIGYKEVLDYFRGLCTYSEMISLIKRASRRYAKRQLTWFKRDNRIKWLDYTNSQL